MNSKEKEPNQIKREVQFYCILPKTFKRTIENGTKEPLYLMEAYAEPGGPSLWEVIKITDIGANSSISFPP